MTVAALPGTQRFRAFQLGKETTFGTPVAATRRFPWSFTPTIDPHWTQPNADTGTLDNALPPYRTGIDLTGQSVGPLAFNDAQSLWAGLLKGGVASTGAGAAKTWDFIAASTSADPYEIFTAEWGDEVTGDQMQFADGIVERLQLQFPQDLGAIIATADWRFASLVYPNTMTGALSVDPASVWAYAADTRLYIDSVSGSIGISPLVNAMHDATITVTGNNDVKRYANGSNARFNVAGYSRGNRTVETAFTLAKSAGALSEFAKFLNAAPQERFIVLDTTSADIITGTTPYTHKVKFAGHWYTRSEQTIGGNTAVSLVCRHMLDTALAGGPIEAVIINSRNTVP